jgi:hypothetical protein
MATRNREWVERRVGEKMQQFEQTERLAANRAPQPEPDRSWRDRSPRRYENDRGGSAALTGDYFLDRMIKRDRARYRSFWLGSDEE